METSKQSVQEKNHINHEKNTPNNIDMAKLQELRGLKMPDPLRKAPVNNTQQNNNSPTMNIPSAMLAKASYNR
jgi:hypothetical protein